MPKERLGPTSDTNVEVLQITTDLSAGFLEGRPGWTENFIRKVAAKWLEAAQVSDAMAFEAGTITSEFVTNTIRYGGAASQLVVARTAPAESHPETVDIVAVNPARGETSTPGTARRGALASKDSNDTSEHGRGLMMTEAYTGGNWGQQNVRSLDGKHEIITFAVLSAAQEAAEAHYEDVA